MFSKIYLTTSNPTLSHFVTQAKQGDAESFGTVYELLAPEIYRYLYCKVDTVETAQDLTQETFIKAYQHLEEFEGNQFRAWVYTIARNTLTDYYRSRKINISFEESGEPPQICTLLDSFFVRSEVNTYLRVLSKKYQDILILRYINDLSIKQVAHITGLSSSNIRVMCTRALAEIRHYVTNLSITSRFSQKAQTIGQRDHTRPEVFMD